VLGVSAAVDAVVEVLKVGEIEREEKIS